MKKTFIASLVGIVIAASTFGQSRIHLDTYLSSTAPYPFITYGSASGSPVGSGMTVGFYYSTMVATFEPGTGGANNGIPGAEWTLATGVGSTAQFIPGFPGLFSTPLDFSVPGNVSTLWLIVVAYNGVSYDTSTSRGHSSVFTIAPNSGLGNAPGVGSNMQGFSIPVLAIPEPSPFALIILGTMCIWNFRRRHFDEVNRVSS
jgi:hypothetical protein